MSKDVIYEIRKSKEKLYELQNDFSNSNRDTIDNIIENFITFCKNDEYVKNIINEIEINIKNRDLIWHDELLNPSGDFMTSGKFIVPLDNDKMAFIIYKLLEGLLEKKYNIYQVVYTRMLRNTNQMISEFVRNNMNKFFRYVQDELTKMEQKEIELLNKKISKENIMKMIINNPTYVVFILGSIFAILGYSYAYRPIIDYGFITSVDMHNMIVSNEDGSYNITIDINNRGKMDYPIIVFIELSNAKFVNIVEEENYRILTNQEQTLIRSFRLKANTGNRVKRTYQILPIYEPSKFSASMRIERLYSGIVHYILTSFFTEEIGFDPLIIEFSRNNEGQYIRID